MKLLKCTFRSPLHGSIECDEVLFDTNGRVELNSEQMATLYNKYLQLEDFLDNNKEDLTFAVPEELSSCIMKAEFGDCSMYEGRLYLLTHVWIDGNDLDDGVRQKIQDWITGQLSDGWGESLEQREWMNERVCVPNTYFDEDTLEFEDSEDYCTALYYVAPWVSDDFYVELVNYEEEEIDAEGDVIAYIGLPNLSKRVLKFDSIMQIFMFIKIKYGKDKAEDITKDINEYSLINGDEYYLIEHRTSDGWFILTNWVVKYGNLCYTYKQALFSGEKKYTNVQMSLEDAIVELLK